MVHIEGFKQDGQGPSTQDLLKDGFKPVDVICWSDGKGTLLFQNGEEYVAVLKPKV